MSVSGHTLALGSLCLHGFCSARVILPLQPRQESESVPSQHPLVTGFTGKWTGPRSEPPPDWLPGPYIIRTTRTLSLMGITIPHTCNRLPPLYGLLLFIHISIHMPVPSKISLHSQTTRTVENASALQLAIDFYYANRNTITIEPHPRKNRSPSRIKKIGISIRRVAAIHSIYTPHNTATVQSHVVAVLDELDSLEVQVFPITVQL